MGTPLGTMVADVSQKVGDRVVGQYFPATEIRKAIGDSYRYYYMQMVTLGEGYFERSENLDTIANDENISLLPLTPEFKNISQLYRYISTGLVPLQRDEGRGELILTLGIPSGDSYLPRYKQIGTNLVLNPRPTQTQVDAFKLDYVYIPEFPGRTTSDVFEFDPNFPTVYEVNVEIRAAIKLLESKDVTGGFSDINTFRQELSQLDKAFMDSLENDEAPDFVAYSGQYYGYF